MPRPRQPLRFRSREGDYRLVEAAARWRPGPGFGVAGSDPCSANHGGGARHRSEYSVRKVSREDSGPAAEWRIRPRQDRLPRNLRIPEAESRGVHFGRLPRLADGSHVGDGMSGMPWQAAAAGEPGGESERHVDRRIHRAANFAGTRSRAEHQAGWPRRENRRSRHARDRRAPAIPECGRTELHFARPLGGDTFRRRRPAHPPGHADRLEAARRALRARRAFDRPASSRQRPPADCAGKSARSRQHRAGGRARRRNHPPRRLRDRSRTRRRASRRRPGGARHAGRNHARTEFADRRLHLRQSADRDASRAAPEERRRAHDSGREGKQSQESRRDLSAGRDDGGDRSFRLRQVDAGERHSLSRAGAPALPLARKIRRAQSHRGRGEYRQGHSHRSVADRPHAALESRNLHRSLHADSRSLRHAARSRASAATSRDAFPSTSPADAARPARAKASAASK